ncbi:hypothetical protein QR680_019354 [Steinernema hermaphroditum]|uniref:G-protein coupled receptors family 1 profile domain-containing protein n=1 Tax=Steinernema hermaphroditum TaxID=289476 RepID=A0AA39GN58_9BILA|nr:hypothetical protein QR680_019354 [Steinernema hermaphroditum]
MEFLTLAIVLITILSVGVFGNVSIVIATYRKKHLKTKIHLMVCIMSMMDLISIGFEFSSAIRMLLGVEAMSRQKCFRFLWIYMVVHNAEMVIALAVALDRVVAVHFPVRYSQTSARATLPIVLLIAFIVGAAPVAAALFAIDDEIIPACNPPLAFPRQLYFYWNGLIVLLSLSILVTYAAVFVQMHRLEKMRKNIRQLRITKALASTIVAYAFTKFTAVTATFFLPLLIHDINVTDTLATYVVILVSIEYGINYWLLLMRKDDTYRRAFLEQVGLSKVAPKEAWTSEGQLTRIVPREGRRTSVRF